jgi:hypothetical protein
MPPRRKKPVEKKRPKKKPVARRPAKRTAPARAKKSTRTPKKSAAKKIRRATRAPTRAPAGFGPERVTLPGIGAPPPAIVQPAPAHPDDLLRDHGLTPERSSVRRDRCDACGNPIESGDWLLHHTPATCRCCAERSGNAAALSTRQSITHDGRPECRAWWRGQLAR